jgi:hypothetical protein
MKTKKLTLVIILFALAVLYFVSFSFAYRSATKDLINHQIETSKNQANLIASLLSEKLKSGFSKEQVKNELQHSIENSSTEFSFVCMFDDTGREICHPNKDKIGKVLLKNNSVIKSVNNYEVMDNFKQAIMDKKAIGGLRKLKKYTEIVYLSPVKGANWVVASHTNVVKFKETFRNLKGRLFFLFLLVWLSSALLIYFFLNKINTQHLKELELLNREVGDKYFNELVYINETISKSAIIPEKIDRLLADKGYQLTPVFMENIAFIYTENKVSYIIEHHGEKSSINLTLDELFKILDKNEFYRASRQVIVSAKAIDKIEKYGTTQLKVITKLISPIDIIISKAKLTDFKKWIGKN